MQFAPRTYYDQKCRPPSKRAINDEEFGDQLEAIWKKNYAVYGRRKLWKAALCPGFAEVMPDGGVKGRCATPPRWTSSMPTISATSLVIADVCRPIER